MEVRCDKCQARYRVDDARIGPQGLTMRCGKCQNTFRVSRAGQVEKPAPSPAAAPKPPAPGPAAPGDEGAGRTMMFQTGNIKTVPPKPKPEPAAGATMVFGQSPLAKPAAAQPKPAARPAEPAPGATMVFGQSPLAKPAAAPPKPAVPQPVAPARAAREPVAPAPMAPEPPAEAAPPEEAAPPQRPLAAGDSGVEAEGAEESFESEPPPKQGTFDKAPPKGLLIGVAVVLAVLIVAFVALFAWRKLGSHPPPAAAVETLTSAQAEGEKDTLAAIAAAEGKAKEALEVAGPRSDFPQATAALARLRVQWADALDDQANLVTAKGGEGADAKASELQSQAKAHLRSAFEVLAPAIKAGPRSPDLQLALADYYRAQRSGSNMNKALKSAQALKADGALVALVQGMAFAQEEDGAEQAIPRLKEALAASPQSARVHFRLALAYLALKDNANASAELKQTLKISPQHERAKAAMEQMTTASADGK